MPTRLLIWLAIELNTTSAQMPMVMPLMVNVVRSLRRDSSRSRRMVRIPPLPGDEHLRPAVPVLDNRLHRSLLVYVV